jgi:hypothetical protein
MRSPRLPFHEWKPATFKAASRFPFPFRKDIYRPISGRCGRAEPKERKPRKRMPSRCRRTHDCKSIYSSASLPPERVSSMGWVRS